MLIYVLVLLLCHQTICDDGEDSESNDSADVTTAPKETVMVTIKQGQIRGLEFENEYNNGKFFSFMDIPYAVPPVGERRFKAPEPHPGWEGVFVTEDGEKSSGCLRMNPIWQSDEGEEDCLILHVFVPKKPEELQNDLKPVMVYIHGGAFHTGQGSPGSYGPDFLIAEDVVVVMMNYRLNVFGFLCTDDEEASGNAGLKDQVLALKWVQENIKAFGGNPDLVTIFGESAGAASVHFLMLSPLSKGLFHRAIAQSGAAVNPWTRSTQGPTHARKLGDLFDCDFNNTKELLQCLRKVSDEDLVTYQYNVINVDTETRDAFVYLPCIEKEGSKDPFITREPQDIIKEGKFHDVPFMIGTMQLETLPILRGLREPRLPDDAKKNMYRTVNKRPESLLPYHWEIHDFKKRRRVGRKVKQFYFGNKRISNATLENLVNESSDTSFLLGTHNSVTYHSKLGKSSVYQYYFTLDTSWGKTKGFLNLKGISGPTHADDLNYIFFVHNNPPSLNPDQLAYQAMKKLVKMWTNFAKFGDPTPDSELGFKWEPAKPDKRYYLEIGEEFTLKEYCEEKRMKFWGKLQLDEGIDAL